MNCGVWKQQECNNVILKKKKTMNIRTTKEEEKEEVQKQGCTVPGRLFAQVTTYCAVAPNIFGIIIAVFSCLSSVHTHREERAR